jgi:hypothetical protein
MLWIIHLYDKHNPDGYPDGYPNDTENYARSGVISLCLTIANVILIIISSMLMFRLKEVRFNLVVDVESNLNSVINIPSFSHIYAHYTCFCFCDRIYIVFFKTAPIKKSIFWTDLGIARKIYHNVAILPKIQRAPDDAEIKKRVTTFFPRASAMLFQSDFRPVNSNSSSGGRGSGIMPNSSYNKSSNLNSSIPRDSSASNSAQAVKGTELRSSITH